MAKKDKNLEAAEIEAVEVFETHAHETAFPEVEILSTGDIQKMTEGEILVVCSRPGMRRAGITHDRFKIYGPLSLSGAQIEEIRRDEAFVVVRVL